MAVRLILVIQRWCYEGRYVMVWVWCWSSVGCSRDMVLVGYISLMVVAIVREFGDVPVLPTMNLAS